MGQFERKRRFSIRTILRLVIVAQVLGIALILAYLVAAAAVTANNTAKVEAGTVAVRETREIQIQLDRARTSLFRYVVSPDLDSVRPYLTARQTMPDLVARAKQSLDISQRAALTRWFEQFRAYQNSIGEPVVSAVVAERFKTASDLLSDKRGRLAFERLERDASKIVSSAVAQRDGAQNRIQNLQYLSIAFIAFAGLLFVGFGVASLVFWRRQFIDPIDQLASSARKLGHGDFSQRMQGSNVAEIEVVARSFNTMADEMELKVHELQELVLDRSDFVASVTHELRTPTTSLRGYLEMLSSGDAGQLTSDQKRFVEIAERNALQLDELIGDLVLLSGLEHAGLSLHRAPLDLGELVMQLKAEMMPIAREKDIDIVIVQTGDLKISADAVRLRQALANLVSNAIKYSPRSKSVVIRAYRAGERVTVAVADWGPGIAPDDLPKVSEPFFRSDSQGLVPGTGLGLAIAKQMIELHGGFLHIESELGKGSTFTLTLPVEPPSVETDADLPGNFAAI
ncbi:MAG: HAMP domain-containing protein [Thermoleophilaceae bacterium]|nr:HAMP domain-containing protein [Thermoleophilaceae bacterium]